MVGYSKRASCQLAEKASHRYICLLILFWLTKLWIYNNFYFKDDKFDALGFLGERVHAFTLVTKTLDLYFQDGIGMHITHVLDNKEPKFINIDNPKDRMLAALEYLKENASVGDLKRAYSKAKKILHGRYYW